jgi:hypothetical protein
MKYTGDVNMNLSPAARRVAFHARHAVAAGEELMYDYGDNFKDYCGVDLI